MEIPKDLERTIHVLIERDDRTRFERAERSQELASLVREFPVMTVAVAGGGHESGWFFAEAAGCYVAGLYAAALVCAHASCERELAGWVNSLGASAPRGWERWGLGRLLEYSVEVDRFPKGTAALLDEVNRKRRDFYHFRDERTPDSIVSRTYDQVTWRGKEFADADMTAQLRVDALQAIRAALDVRAIVL